MTGYTGYENTEVRSMSSKQHCKMSVHAHHSLPSAYIRAGHFQPKGAQGNFLRTRLGATLVYAYVERGMADVFT